MNQKTLAYVIFLARLFVTIVFLQFDCCGCFVFGNSGPFETSARIVGEPVGSTFVSVSKEDLEIDLRPLADYQMVEVKAIYTLENLGPAEKLTLAFAFGSEENANHRVLFNGEKIVGVKKLEGREITKKWWPPENTPALRSEDSPMRFGGWRPIEALGFELEIPTGTSTLEVSYAEDAKVVFGRPSMYRQFAYILSPAKSWSSFQNLNVVVYSPADWEIASSVDLAVVEGKLLGQFSTLPADTLAFTLRPRVHPLYLAVTDHAVAIVIVVLLLILWINWKIGRAMLRDVDQREFDCELPTFSRSVVGMLRQAVLSGLLLGGAVFFVSLGVNIIFPMVDAEEMYRAKLQLSDGYLSIGKFFLVIICTVFMASFVFLARLILFFRCKKRAGVR